MECSLFHRGRTLFNRHGVSFACAVRDISILATDLDAGVIERAKVGLYPERALKEVPPTVVKQYFVNEGHYYQVKDEIKKTVTFKQHNLLKDRYDTGFDLIVCRNVMIYFTEEAKDQIYTNFSKSLKPGGILICRKHRADF